MNRNRRISLLKCGGYYCECHWFILSHNRICYLLQNIYLIHCGKLDVKARLFLFTCSSNLQKGLGQTLYSAWTHYIPAFLQLTSVIIRSPQVLPQTSSTEFLATLGAPLAWDCLIKFYSPWLSPLSSQHITLPNWSKIPVWFPHQISEASTIVSALVDQVSFLQTTFVTVSTSISFYNLLGY
jgi:hypothetical protein